MVLARNIDGHLVDRFQESEQKILASWVSKWLRRLEKDLNRIAQLHIREKGYDKEGPLWFKARWDGDKTVIVTPSNAKLFQKLEFGEFDPQGRMINAPHPVWGAWKLEVRL